MNTSPMGFGAGVYEIGTLVCPTHVTGNEAAKWPMVPINSLEAGASERACGEMQRAVL